MTKSYSKKILRGVKIDGTTYCSPHGAIEDSQKVTEQNKDNLKALEDFWYKKGIDDGEKSGYEKGFKEGLGKGTAQGIAQGKKEGVEEGRAMGHKEGADESKSASKKELESSFQLLEKLAESLTHEKELLFQKMKPEIIQFSLSVCERILQKELKDPDNFTELFQQLMAKASPIIKAQPVKIHLPKESFNEHRSLIERETLDIPSDSHLHFSSDPSLSEGSIKIETELGLINFDIPRLIKELEASALSDTLDDL